jgi:hypothetical protein
MGMKHPFEVKLQFAYAFDVARHGEIELNTNGMMPSM